MHQSCNYRDNISARITSDKVAYQTRETNITTIMQVYVAQIQIHAMNLQTVGLEHAQV